MTASGGRKPGNQSGKALPNLSVSEIRALWGYRVEALGLSRLQGEHPICLPGKALTEPQCMDHGNAFVKVSGSLGHLTQRAYAGW